MKLNRHQNRRPRKYSLGFSLIEATIGMGTVATVVVALYGALTASFSGVKMARENLRATQILVEKMDTIRLYSWDQIKTPGFIPTKFEVPFDPTGAKNGTGAGVRYYGTVTFTDGPTDVSYGTDLKWVKVTLQWKTGNLERKREFSSMVCRNGLQSYIY
jgi:hypothetical protein